MSSAQSSELSDNTALPEEAAPPIRFNIWKHHAGAIRWQLIQIAQGGQSRLLALPDQLRVIGTDLMDLYLGPLTPAQIGMRICEALTAGGRLERTSYQAWIDAGGGYRVLGTEYDECSWVLRLGSDSERYVHVHPARNARQTRRVRATVLKTAIAVLAQVAVHGGDPLDVVLINQVRRQILDLPPIASLASSQGLVEVLKLLRAPPVSGP